MLLCSYSQVYSLHIVVSARFVDFALNDPRALQLLDYVQNDTSVPDEWYFSTLNHNPRFLPAPGAFLGAANGTIVQSDRPNRNWELPNKEYPFLNRIKAWQWGPIPCRLILNYCFSNLCFYTVLYHVPRKYCKWKYKFIWMYWISICTANVSVWVTDQKFFAIQSASGVTKTCHFCAPVASSSSTSSYGRGSRSHWTVSRSGFGTGPTRTLQRAHTHRSRPHLSYCPQTSPECGHHQPLFHQQ